jgi:RNA polymerase sigma-B factor
VVFIVTLLFATSLPSAEPDHSPPAGQPAGAPILSVVPSLPPETEPSSGTVRARSSAELLNRAATADRRERDRLLDEVIHLNMGVARSVASRYRHRGIPEDDLVQVAYLGLVKAVQGFDPAFERDFLSYAVPTIRGEVRRYFRDHGWTVRPPRRVQELQAAITAAAEDLTQSIGRSPRPSELAAYLEVDQEEVIAALAANGCFTPTSLDRPVGEDGDATLGELIGCEDGGVDSVDARVMLGPAVRSLKERDRRILYLRFFAGRTQQEIATEIGVTQMQVSRLITRILRDLRLALT